MSSPSSPGFPLSASPEDWKPAPDKLEKLAPEHRATGFQLRPPAGARHRTAMDEKEVRDIWGVEKDPQTPLGILIVTVAKGPKNNLPLDQDIEVVLNFAKTRYQNLLNNPPEFGTVNGHAFARVRFRAEGLRGVHGLESGEVFGFLYVTDDGQTPIVIQGAGRADVIELIEASAQTVRLTP